VISGKTKKKNLDDLKQYFTPIGHCFQAWKRDERLSMIHQQNSKCRFCVVTSWSSWYKLEQELKKLNDYNVYGYKPKTEMDLKLEKSFDFGAITKEQLKRTNDFKVTIPFIDQTSLPSLLGSTIVFKPPLNQKNEPMYTVMEHNNETLVMVIQMRKNMVEYLPPQSSNDVHIKGFDKATFQKLKNFLQTSDPPFVYISFGCLAMNPLIAALNSHKPHQ